MRTFLLLGSCNALLAVAFGAFAAHALAGQVTPERLDVFKTGAEYQFYHAFGLILIAFLIERFPTGQLFLWAGRLMTIGIILFSGSLYTLVLTNNSMWGMVTPLGGSTFIIAWLLVAIGAVRQPAISRERSK